MSTTLLPVLDNDNWPDVWTKTGGDGTYYSCVNTSDGDTSYLSKGSTALLTFPAFKMRPFNAPADKTGWTFTMRARTTLGTGGCTLDVYQGDPADGGSFLETLSFAGFTASYSDVTATMTPAIVATISDASDLWIVPGATGGTSTRRVTFIKLDVPNTTLIGGAGDDFGAQIACH